MPATIEMHGIDRRRTRVVDVSIVALFSGDGLLIQIGWLLSDLAGLDVLQLLCLTVWPHLLYG